MNDSMRKIKSPLASLLSLLVVTKTLTTASIGDTEQSRQVRPRN